ncbi:putative transcription factor bZIP family [Helianthus anomalus]
MNLDELLMSVYSAETNQAVSSNAVNYTNRTQLDSGVTKKMVDEVWFTFGDVMEKIVERRQKRMMKNRESAARSRVTKQVVISVR